MSLMLALVDSGGTHLNTASLGPFTSNSCSRHLGSAVTIIDYLYADVMIHKLFLNKSPSPGRCTVTDGNA